MGTFRQFTFGLLLHFINCYQTSTDTLYPTTFGQLLLTHINLVNFITRYIQDMFIHILRYRIYSTSVKIKVQLTDNSLASETKHELFAGSSSIVLEGYQRSQVKVGFLNPSCIFNSLLLRHFNLSGCVYS